MGLGTGPAGPGRGADPPQPFSKHHLSPGLQPCPRGLLPGFSSQPSRGRAEPPREERFHQPPCLGLSRPLLSLSKSVSIAGNPGSGTADALLLPQQKSHKGQGSPLYKENKQVSGSQGVGVGWEGGRLGGGVWTASWLSAARAPPHCFPLYLPLPPRSPEPDWTVAGDGCLPLSSRECSWLKPPYCSAGPEQFHPPGARATSKANLILPLPCSIPFHGSLQPSAVFLHL